jgi:hypothetical protein
MYELVNVRMYAIGPASARFDVTLDLRMESAPDVMSIGTAGTDRTAFIASSIAGENGVGKSILTRLMRLVVTPELLDQSSDESRWYDLVAPDKVGQIILKWYDTKHFTSLITGLAMQRRANGAGLEIAYYTIQHESGFDINALILAQPESTVPKLRDHMTRVVAGQVPTDSGRAADKVVSAVQVVFRGDGRDAGGGHSRPGSGGGRVG